MSKARTMWQSIRSRLVEPVISQSVMIRYSAALAVMLTVLTACVGWSAVTRLRDLYGSIPKRLAELRWLERIATHADRRALVDAVEQYREHRDVETQLTALEANRHDALAAWVSTSTGFEKALKRPITVTADDPPQLVVGEAPTYPWLPDKLAWCIASEYRNQLNAWYKAKLMCDQLNAGEKAFVSQIDDLREKHRRTQAALAACRTKVEDQLSEAFRRAQLHMPPTDEQAAEVTSTIDVALRWSDLHARDTWATGAQAWFFLLDIPTFLTCLAMTAAAWSRFLLASDWLGQTRITG